VFGGPFPADLVAAGCNNVPAGQPFFDVHGTGFYMTKDGSVLYLVYHEMSANPFIFGAPPFVLHDCGVWKVDPANNSTGVFAGATGSGKITADVPVNADFSAHVSATYTGSVTLADGGRAPAGPREVTCSGVMNEVPITANLRVKRGQFCDLEHSAVNGNVHVERGASLFMQNSVADGDVECDDCASANLIYSTAFGDLRIHNAATGSSIVGTVVTGNLRVRHSGPGAFTIESNAVGRNLSFHRNSGPSKIAGNTVGRKLSCHGNDPAPALQDTVILPGFPPIFLVGNTADTFRGQCAP
jgi:hypothetical protein